MRKKNNGYNVRTITTGNPEADMLGQVYLWVSERTNRKYPQRPHKTYKRRPTQSIFRVVIKSIQTALLWPVRKVKALEDKAEQSRPKYLSGLRKNKRNGN